MRYRIEYADGRCCNYANSSKDLIVWLKLLKDETITDIRKVYKSGVSDSVMEIRKIHTIRRKRVMQKCICIPMEQYELMLATYDKVVEELESMKKALEELADSPKAE